MSKVVKLVLALGALPAPAVAQADSVRASRPPIIRPAEAVAAVGLIGVAALFDRTVRDRAEANRSRTSDRLAQIGNATGSLLYVGPVLAAGWIAGRLVDKPALSDAALRAAAAAVVAGGVTGVLKLGFGRVRPRDGRDATEFHPFTAANASFPSGHVTVAVAIATSLAHATPDGWSDVAFYATAGLTGFARINDNKHWLSDVVGGALVGYLVGRQITRQPAKGAAVIAGPGTLGLTVPFR